MLSETFARRENAGSAFKQDTRERRSHAENSRLTGWTPRLSTVITQSVLISPLRFPPRTEVRNVCSPDSEVEAYWGRQRVAPGRNLIPNAAYGREPLEHDPEKWIPVFRKRSCSTKDLERDRDSTQSHRALAHDFADVRALAFPGVTLMDMRRSGVGRSRRERCYSSALCAG